MAAKLTRLTHITAIQMHLVAESCTICSPRSRWPVCKLLDTPLYVCVASPDSVKIHGIKRAHKFIKCGKVQYFFNENNESKLY
jgi:hypothetical protein